jgi:hypothetical protein
MQHPQPEEIELRSPVHTAFTEVFLIRGHDIITFHFPR